MLLLCGPGLRAALVALMTTEIQTARWPLAPRTKALRAILDKLEPAPPRPEPFPRPKPPAQPSMALARKKRRPRHPKVYLQPPRGLDCKLATAGIYPLVTIGLR
jgi:hypothetical protein